MTRSFYTLLMRLALPLALARLYWRGAKTPAYRQRIGERLSGRPSAPRSDFWIHAVSVGEVQAAAPLLRELLIRDPSSRILVTTATPTGAERLTALFGERVAHRYAPFDLPAMVARFLAQTQPRLAIVMETEIWPNILHACAQRGIPTILANARLSQRSARRYARIAALTRQTLAGFTLIAAQTDADAQRFVALGAEPSRVRVTGNLKFDLCPPAGLSERVAEIRRIWGETRPVWIAASTHAGEERAVLEAHRKLRQRIPQALLVLVPRHPERFAQVATLVARHGLALARRSQREVCRDETAVFLGDTMGELPVFLAAGDAAFIGGSLVPVGGHNPLEASAAGVPVIVGPHTFNFVAMMELLRQEGAAVHVAHADALAECLIAWFANAALRTEIGERGRRVVAAHRGALMQLMSLIDALRATPRVNAPNTAATRPQPFI